MELEKPCPFCQESSGAIVKSAPHAVGGVQVECENCGARGPIYDTDKDAIKGWNKGIGGGSGFLRKE